MRIVWLIILFPLVSLAQTETDKRILKGEVVDSQTGDPLAFVNVVYGNPPRGTTTNIDGFFELQVDLQAVKYLEVSYLGYEAKRVELSEFSGVKRLRISLHPTQFALEEVIVKPGFNPANRIIQKVYRHKEENNPQSLDSYSFRSYNKMIFTLDTLRVKTEGVQDSVEIDSTDHELRKMLEKQHLMLMESASLKEYLAPDLTNEQVIASRVSGFKDPSLVFLATEFQSFSFYDEFIQIGGYNYLNPVTKKSPRKYYFRLEDTLVNQRSDTVFVISFQPRGGKNFDALKGMLHVNSHHYALEKVIAEPVDPPGDFTIKIQQQYELVEGQQWFPTQLNTRIEFHDLIEQTKHFEYILVGDGRTYIRDIKLNPPLDRKKFDHVTVNIPSNAYAKSEDTWDQYRTRELSSKDQRTYEFVDSLGKAHQFDKKLRTFQILTTGYYPLSVFNLELDKFVGYNQYEGLRLGAGFMTNDKVSSFFSVGGYIGYGFRDKQYKYGGRFKVFMDKSSESQLDLAYTKDVMETGGYEFLEKDRSLLSTDLFRDYLIADMYLAEQLETGFSFRSFKYLKNRFYWNYSQINPFDSYSFQLENQPLNEFENTEIGLEMKYAYREKFVQTPWGKFSEGTNFPVLYLNVRKGLKSAYGQFDYLKMEGNIDYSFITKVFGTTSINLVGGVVEGAVPLYNLYNGHGSYTGRFSIQVDNSFATMRLNEFYADRFFSVFFRQNFGSLLLRTSVFDPRISLANHMGWGVLNGRENHQNVDLLTFSKGYYEAGLIIDDIISAGFLSYGLGIFYRYGPYAFDNPSKNLAYKVSFRFKL